MSTIDQNKKCTCTCHTFLIPRNIGRSAWDEFMKNYKWTLPKHI